MLLFLGLSVYYACGPDSERESWLNCDHPSGCDSAPDRRTIPSIIVTRMINMQGTAYSEPWIAAYLGHNWKKGISYKFLCDGKWGGMVLVAVWDLIGNALINISALIYSHPSKCIITPILYFCCRCGSITSLSHHKFYFLLQLAFFNAYIVFWEKKSHWE